MELNHEKVIELFHNHKDVIILGGFGLVMVLIGVKEWQRKIPVEDIVEIDEVKTADEEVVGDVVVDISGAVERPGVYRFEIGSRVSQALEAAGGFSEDAKKEWISQNLNLAAELADGSKLYIPSTDEEPLNEDQNSSRVAGTSSVNVNSATLEELKQLKGVGEVRAQSIIDNRPYSSIEDLQEKADIPTNVIEDNKDSLVVY